MGSRVTIKDVANNANVSITTASFALNNVKGRVSEEIREKVMESARKLHYTANTSARSLRTNDSKTIMFVFTKEYLKERNVAYMTSLSGCVEYAEMNGKGVLLEIIDTEKSLDELVDRFIRIWESGRVNGIIFQCFFEDDRDDELYRRLYNAGVNLVNISRIGDSSDYPCVYLEEFQIVRDQVKYAIKKGYDKLYYVCRKHRTYGIRERGFLDEIDGENADGEVINYYSRECNENEMWQLIEPILNECGEKRIAFICWCDNDAIVLIKALNKHGVKIPEKVGIMGFDNIPLSEYINPKLTTATQPFIEMTKAALDVLIRAESNDSTRSAEHILVDGEIVERDSM